MKKLMIVCSMALAVLFTSNKAQAQITSSNEVLQAAAGLVNVQVSGVNVTVSDIPIDITVTDVIDVSNVLNNADIRILNNILNDLTIDNVLNNLLRDANILNNSQVVVGVIVNALGETVFLVSKRTRR